jgi:hypothetical protein
MSRVGLGAPKADLYTYVLERYISVHYNGYIHRSGCAMFSSAARKPEDLYNEVDLTDKERASQTKMIMRLFDLWKISSAQQAICLGLSPHTRASLHNYKSGKAYLPLYRDIQDRISILLTIHSILRRLFPENDEIVYTWISRRNKYFDNYTPLEIICRDSYPGLIKVKDYLENALTI